MSRVLLMHPDTFRALLETTKKAHGSRDEGGVYCGIEVIVNTLAPKFRVRWQFPRERFFEYEPSDEYWCRYFGFGGEVETDELAIFEMQVPCWGAR